MSFSRAPVPGSEPSPHSVFCIGRRGPCSSGTVSDDGMAPPFRSNAELRVRGAARKEQRMIAGGAAILILVFLAAVHLYWAAGGKAGKSAAIPTAEGRAVIKPSALATATVAAALSAAAALVALRIGWFAPAGFVGDSIFVRAAVWLLAAVFALRAIGDFRYVGFFKRVRDTGFARLDTLAYSPLCAGLAVLIGIAASG
jgi:Protein of unknown function (DUF3995)